MNDDHISEDAAKAIWRRAAQLQAEAERRAEEHIRRLPAAEAVDTEDGYRPEDVRAAGEEAGISAEFVEIALAEAAASGVSSSALAPRDLVGARLFLGATRQAIEATATVQGSVQDVSAAALQVFSGHPCLLQAGEVAELPSWSGRVLVFNVPGFDWSVTANPPFVEKASVVGLRQLHIAIRPLPGDVPTCEVVVAGDLSAGVRSRWRWSAATAVGSGAAGGALGVGLAGSAVAGALLVVPALLGVAVVGTAAVGGWSLTYRYYRSQLEKALHQSLALLAGNARAIAANTERPSPPVQSNPRIDPGRVTHRRVGSEQAHREDGEKDATHRKGIAGSHPEE